MFINLMAGGIGIRDVTLPQTIELAKKHGFAGIDFNIVEAGKLADEHGVAYVKDLFAKAGVLPGGWGAPVNMRGDAAEFKQSVADLGKYADLAVALGSNRALGGISPCSDDKNWDEQWAWAIEHYAPVAQTLKEHGCRYGLEFIGPKTIRGKRKYEFIYSMKDTLKFAKAIGTGNMGVLLDHWHLYTSYGTIDEVRALTNADVVAVHVNDAPKGIDVDEQIDNRRLMPLESGVLDIKSFLEALKSIGFDGPVTCEPFSARINAMSADEALAETAATMRKAFALAGVAS